MAHIYLDTHTYTYLPTYLPTYIHSKCLKAKPKQEARHTVYLVQCMSSIRESLSLTPSPIKPGLVTLESGEAEVQRSSSAMKELEGQSWLLENFSFPHTNMKVPPPTETSFPPKTEMLEILNSTFNSLILMLGTSLESLKYLVQTTDHHFATFSRAN